MEAPLKTNRWAKRWAAFRRPLEGEKLDYLRERWKTLPASLQTPNQIAGRHLTHCGFITGPSYCSFHCTHCYLPGNANEVPIPSLAEIKATIDANRRFQGPGAGLQITGGDVADAYWRSGRPDELVEIIRYTYASGLIPMLMTHGQTLLEQPAFFERLVMEGGLRQVSVHIDRTQAGRRGFPIQKVQSEADLHPIRQAFTDRVLEIREKTGAALELALTFTVTEANLEDVPEVIRWYLADPMRTHVWRILSFQPEADTGRTRFSSNPATPDRVWAKLQEGLGHDVRRDVSIFGHPDCNSWCPVLMDQRSGRYQPLLPDDPRFDPMLGKILERIGGLSLVNDDAGTPPYKLAGLLLQNAGLLLRLLLYFGPRFSFRMWRSLLTGKAHTVGIGIHNFMDAEEVARAEDDPVIRARLDACVFKGAIREGNEWKAVPMCSMNQAKWAQVYDQRLQDETLRQQPQATDRV